MEEKMAEADRRGVAIALLEDRIAFLERMRDLLQADNTRLVLENRELRSRIGGFLAKEPS